MSNPAAIPVDDDDDVPPPTPPPPAPVELPQSGEEAYLRRIAMSSGLSAVAPAFTPAAQTLPTASIEAAPEGPPLRSETPPPSVLDQEDFNTALQKRREAAAAIAARLAKSAFATASAQSAPPPPQPSGEMITENADER